MTERDETDDYDPGPEDGGDQQARHAGDHGRTPRRPQGRQQEPLRFAGEEQRDTTGDQRSFVIEDPLTGRDLTPVLYAFRPKQWMLLKIGDTEGQEQIDLFLEEVMDPESAEYLRDRFEDSEDDFDVDALAPTIEGLIGLWYGRPTGRRAGSSGRPRGNPRSGRRSTVRRR